MSFPKNSSFSEPHLFPLQAFRKVMGKKIEKMDPEEQFKLLTEAWYTEVNDIVHTFDDRHSGTDEYRNRGVMERLTDLRDDMYKELR